MFMKSQRPKLEIPLTTFEIILQVLALMGLAAGLLTVFLSWNGLPDKIPTHFGLAGTADAWGGKGSLFILPGMVLGMYILLSIVERFPHTYNYLCEITEQNAEVQYRNARMMIVCLKTGIVWLFGYIEWVTVQVAMGKAAGLGASFLPVFLLLMFGTVGFFIYRMVKYR